MELRHLRYFAAVAELENVSRAAVKLHVSQPALSRQIRDLEDEIGVALLERGAKSVRLTPAGRTFLIEARAVLARADEAVKAARAAAAETRDELHIGYAPTLTARILPPALRRFAGLLPKVRVKLHDLSSEEMLLRLREHKLHVAIMVHPGPRFLRGLTFDEVAREPLRLGVGVRHPFAQRRSVSLDEAAREPLLAYSAEEYPEYRQLLKDIFGREHLHVTEEHDGVSSLISGLEAGHGVAVVPGSIRCIAGPRVKLMALRPNPKPLVIGALSDKERELACTQAFIESLKSAAAFPAP